MALPPELTVSDGALNPRAWMAFWNIVLTLPPKPSDEALEIWRGYVRAGLAMSQAMATAVAVSATTQGQTIIAAQANALATAVNEARIKANAINDTSALQVLAVVPLLIAPGWLFNAGRLLGELWSATMPQDRTGYMAAVSDAWDDTVMVVGKGWQKFQEGIAAAVDAAADIGKAAAFGIGTGIVIVIGIVLLARSRRGGG